MAGKQQSNVSINQARDTVNPGNCDREPIHIPGAILPPGVMLVLDCTTLGILQAAGDTLALLGKPVQPLPGSSAETLFSLEQIKRPRGLGVEPNLQKPRHFLDPTWGVGRIWRPASGTANAARFRV